MREGSRSQSVGCRIYLNVRLLYEPLKQVSKNNDRFTLFSCGCLSDKMEKPIAD
jgi:hypothetical protein